MGAGCVGMNADSDLLVVRKDESLDYHKGVLHDVTDDAVRFELDGDILPVKRSKVYGFAYRHGVPASRPPAICRITDAAGSQWPVHSLGLAGKLQWTTPAGLNVAQAIDKIVQIDFSGGKIVYLSDLKPESVRWTPYFGPRKPLAAEEQFYAPRFDHNFDGGTLLLAGTSIPQGTGAARPHRDHVSPARPVQPFPGGGGNRRRGAAQRQDAARGPRRRQGVARCRDFGQRCAAKHRGSTWRPYGG